MALPETRPATSQSNSVTAPITSYDATGIVEQIEDVVSLISPADTPCYSTFRKTTTRNPVVSWQEDELRAPANNRAVEGGTPSASTQARPGLVSNYCQLFDETAEVSSTSMASEHWGMSDPMEYQEMKRAKEIKRDIERAFVGVDNAAAVGDASTARELGSMSRLINSDNRHANGGTARAITEALVLALHQDVYEDGGDPNWLLVSPADSLDVANFAYVSPVAGAANQPGTRQRTVGEGTLYNKVETYLSPFGTLSVVTDRFCAGAVAEDDGSAPENGDGMAFLIDTELCFVPVLQPMQSVPLAKVGHADRKLVFTELTLGLMNSKGCGVLQDLNL